MTRSEFLLHGKDLPVKRILATPGKSPLTRISKLTYTSRQGPNTLSWHRVKVDDKLFYHNHARKKPYDQNLEPRDEECQFLQQAGAVALIRAMPGTSEVHSQHPWPEKSPGIMIALWFSKGTAPIINWKSTNADQIYMVDCLNRNSS